MPSERKMGMITVYGMKSCPDCIAVEEKIRGNDNFKMVDIGEHVRNMKEFLLLRDREPAFSSAKENGFIGIPCFVREDGSVTLSPEEVGLH